MENTRQLLKIKMETNTGFDKINTEEVNELINLYLKKNKFIEIDYNNEKVLKHNSIMTKLDFFKTYLKIHYSENDEITIIGWVVWKGKEYGFDDIIDLNEPYQESKWDVTKNLFYIFFAFASGLTDSNDNFICKRINSSEALLPTEKNLFILSK